MSYGDNPTVRLYNTDDLARIESGDDPWLTTLFANAKTYSEQSIRTRMRLMNDDTLSEYQVCISDEDDEFGLIETIHATDDSHAIRFAYAMWDAEAILDIVAITRSFRPLSLPGAVA